MRAALTVLGLWTVAVRGDLDLPDGCEGLHCNCTLSKSRNITGYTRHHTVKYRISRAVDLFDLKQDCFQEVLKHEEKRHKHEAEDKIDQLKDWLKGNESQIWSATGKITVHNASRDAKKEYKEAVEQAYAEHRTAEKQPGADRKALAQQLHDKKQQLEQQKDDKIKAAKQQAHTEFASTIAPKKQAFEEEKKAIEDKRAEKNKASMDSYKQKVNAEEQTFEQDIIEAARSAPAGRSRAALSADSDHGFDSIVLVGCLALVAAVVATLLQYLQRHARTAPVESDYGSC